MSHHRESEWAHVIVATMAMIRRDCGQNYSLVPKVNKSCGKPWNPWNLVSRFRMNFFIMKAYEHLFFVILLSIFALTPAPIRAHSRSFPLTAALTPAPFHTYLRLYALTTTHSHTYTRLSALTTAHSRSLPPTPTLADARISTRE